MILKLIYHGIYLEFQNISKKTMVLPWHFFQVYLCGVWNYSIMSLIQEVILQSVFFGHSYFLVIFKLQYCYVLEMQYGVSMFFF